MEAYHFIAPLSTSFVNEPCSQQWTLEYYLSLYPQIWNRHLFRTSLSPKCHKQPKTRTRIPVPGASRTISFQFNHHHFCGCHSWPCYPHQPAWSSLIVMEDHKAQGFPHKLKDQFSEGTELVWWSRSCKLLCDKFKWFKEVREEMRLKKRDLKDGWLRGLEFLKVSGLQSFLISFQSIDSKTNSR